MEGYLLGLGVVLDNPSFYDHTALQPIIIHYFASPTFIFRKIKMTTEYLRQEKQWK